MNDQERKFLESNVKQLERLVKTQGEEIKELEKRLDGARKNFNTYSAELADQTAKLKYSK